MMTRDNEEMENDDALHQVITALRQIPRPAPPETLRRRVMAGVHLEQDTIPHRLDLLVTRTEEIVGGRHLLYEDHESAHWSPQMPLPTFSSAPRRHSQTPGCVLDVLHCGYKE